MRIDLEVPVVAPDDFARRFQMRANNLMWLLGAGASASSGIPTAREMLWEFKQALYVSQRRISLKLVEDLSNPTIRMRLQSFVDASGSFPPENAPDEYAAIFEAVWPSEADRRTYIDSKIRDAKPSYGHLALATLLKADRARMVWTTNFDSLVADACAKVFGTTAALTTVALDAPDLGRDLIVNGRWPIEIKLHGDFRSRRLKNTSEELRHQDEQFRATLIEACESSGLIVVGYSGRDDLIMSTLMKALEHPSPFPAGLFWLHRGESPLPPSVVTSPVSACSRGVSQDHEIQPIFLIQALRCSA